MAYAEIAGDRIDVVSQWSQKDLIKSIPGSGWDKDKKVWHVPLTWAACLQLRGVLGTDLKLGPQLSAWGMDTKKHTQNMLSMRGLTSADDFAPWSDKLYGYQKAGVRFLVNSDGVLLADEMGTGKTIQTLSALRFLHEQKEGLPALIICPNSMKRTWAKEAAVWFPEATVYVVEGTSVKKNKTLMKAKSDPSALVIINIEAVRLHSRVQGFGSIALRKCTACDKLGGEPGLATSKCEVHPKELDSINWAVAVVDEAHRIKDGQAKQTRAVWGATKNARRRYALTGTPIASSPADLWAVMHYVAPQEYPTKSKFVDRYCVTMFNGVGAMEIGGLHPKTEPEFRHFFEPRMRRMPKALVLPFLPPKVRTTRYVQMTDKQRKAYEQMDTMQVTRLDDGTLMVQPDQIAALTRLIQFSSAYMEFAGMEMRKNPKTGEMEEVPTYKMTDTSPKLDAMEDILSEMGDKQIAVAAVSSQLIDLAASRLAKAGISYGKITGDVPQWERDIYLQKFQAGQLRVMLFTIAAGGVGLTMTAADTILFLQRSWSMIENKQAEDRVHRIGSQKHESVQVIDLVAEGTKEEDQIEAVQLKADKLEQVVQDAKVLANA